MIIDMMYGAQLDKEPMYLCNSELNDQCTKNGCVFKSAQQCFTTRKVKYAQVDPIKVYIDNPGERVNPLGDMFRMQAQFQRRVDARCFTPNIRERVAYIKDHSLYMQQELNEMLYELPYFKNWKDYSSITMEECEEAFKKAQKEMIDTWHFFMNISLALGITAEDFNKLYLEKIAENNRRQDDGYTHKDSYR